MDIELLGAGEQAGPFENENWVANVWKFQLLHGAHRPMGFWRYRRMWEFSRPGLPQWVTELLDAGETAGPFGPEQWVSNAREFQLLHGAHRPQGFGCYRRDVGLYSGGPAPMRY